MFRISSTDVALDQDPSQTLQKVFDEHCLEVGCHPESFDAKQVANALFHFYQFGFKTEDELQYAVAGHELVLKACC